MTMRKLVLLLLAVVGSNLALSAPAHAEVLWRNWGSCKFAESRPDALARFEQAIKHMSMPEEVKAEFRKLIVTESKPGSETAVRPQQFYEEMQSCNGHLIKGGIRVGEYLDPRGKTIIGHLINATEWTVDYQGRRYTLVLPEVCFNWMWKVSDIPVLKEKPPVLDCAELFIPVQPGDKLTVSYRPAGYLPKPSECFAFKQGSGDYTVQPCLTCFDVTTTGVTLRFSLEAITHEIGVCIKRDGKPSCVVVIEPADWKEKKFSLDPRYWRWDNCTGRPDDK